jgi:hypothetical protein
MGSACDHRLVGASRAVPIASVLLIAAATIIAAITVLAVTMLLANWHPEGAMLLLATFPACLAARLAAASLRPMA